MSQQYYKPAIQEVEDEYDAGTHADRPTRNMLSKDEFNRMVENVLTLASNANLFKTIIRDSEFARIGELFRLFGKGEWSLRPRTFTILRMLGCMEAMDTFVSEQRTDVYLPYTESNLPKDVRGSELRAKFIQLQSLVLSSKAFQI
jgi:hypothetical protein